MAMLCSSLKLFRAKLNMIYYLVIKEEHEIQCNELHFASHLTTLHNLKNLRAIYSSICTNFEPDDL